MAGKSVTVGIRVPEELRDKLLAIASERDRTLSQLCMLVLRDYVEDLEKQRPAGDSR
jgi:predicted transcriptional regulator